MFDHRPKNILDGFVFGSHPTACDIVPGGPSDGIGASHFSITFHEENPTWLVLKDTSRHGTAVSYHGQARDDKRNRADNFTWILFPGDGEQKLILGHQIDEKLLPGAPFIEFSVEVAGHESCVRAYTGLRDAYLATMRNALLSGLNTDSQPSTAGQTRLHSPKQQAKQRPIWIDLNEIGRGAFGVVHIVVDVSTGNQYAARTLPLRTPGQMGREVNILREISHVSLNIL